MHEKSIYHCDIKGNNLVFDEYGNIKLIDFGSIVFSSVDYGKYGLTLDYNFVHLIDRFQIENFPELPYIFEMYSIYSMIY